MYYTHQIDRKYSRGKALLSLMAMPFFVYTFLQVFVFSRWNNFSEWIEYIDERPDYKMAIILAIVVAGCFIYFWPRRNTSVTTIKFTAFSLQENNVLFAMTTIELNEDRKLKDRIQTFKSSQKLFEFIELQKLRKELYRDSKILIKDIDQLDFIQKASSIHTTRSESINHVDPDFRKSDSPVRYSSSSHSYTSTNYSLVYKDTTQTDLALHTPFKSLLFFLSKEGFIFEENVDQTKWLFRR